MAGIMSLGRLFAQKGNIQVFERTVFPEGGRNYYSILTSLKDGKPFKEIIRKKELSVGEKFHTLVSPQNPPFFGTSSNEKYLRSIPQKVRQTWNEAYQDMNWFHKYGEADVIPWGHKTVVKNFETGEVTTIVNAAASNHDLRNGKDGIVRMLSSQTKKDGKITKEYGRVFVNADEGICRDLSTRTYTRNQSNPNGTITLESSLRDSKYDPNGDGSYGAVSDLWTSGAKKGILPNGTNVNINGDKVSTTFSADTYDPAKHYLSYHV